MPFFARRADSSNAGLQGGRSPESDRISSKHSIDGDPSDPYPQLDPIEPTPAEPGMSPMLAKVLGMLGFDPAQLQEMSEKTALVVKDAQERLTRIEGKLDELLTERHAVHTALKRNGAVPLELDSSDDARP
jgi:hypothetical protein